MRGMLCISSAVRQYPSRSGHTTEAHLSSYFHSLSFRFMIGGACRIRDMNARRLLFTLVLLPCLALFAQAQPYRTITAGTSPAFLFADAAHGHVHALTAGSDKNFNGVLEPDSGDVAPQWFVIDAGTEQVVSSMTFEGFFSSFPIRAGVDLEGRHLYVAQLGRVREYDLNTQNFLRDSIATGSFGAISFDSLSGMVVIAERTTFSGPDFVSFVDPVTRTLMGRVRAGVGPSMAGSRANGEHAVEHYIMNEGVFGSPNSSISFSSMRPDVYLEENAKALGGGGNFVITKGNLAFVALGGGQKIHVINTLTHRDLPYSPIVMGAAGPNGPRTLAFEGDSILLGGIAGGQLLRIRIATGQVVTTVAVPGRVESIAVRDSLAFVASRAALSQTTLVGDSSVFVVNLHTGQLVDTIPLRRGIAGAFISANRDLHVIGYNTQDTYWWAVLDGTTLQQKSMGNFNGSLGDPLRTYYNPVSDSLYMVVSDSLNVYSVAAAGVVGKFLYTAVLDSNRLAGVSDGSGYLLIHEAGGLSLNPMPEYLHVLTMEGQLVGKFRTRTRPSVAARVQTSRGNSIGFYALDRGVPQSQASHIDFFEFQPNILGDTVLGGGANHIGVYGPGLIVTLNGSNEVVGINLNDWEVAKRASTHTSGFDGPRESYLFQDGRLMVTTYAGDLRVLNESNANYGVNPIGGKGEGMAVMGGKVFVARSFAPDYSPDSVVVVMDITSLVSSVERVADMTGATSLEQNYPNPVVDAATIRFGLGTPQHVTLTLYTADGRAIETLIDRPMESGSYAAELRTSGLPSGSYIYTLRAGTTLLSKSMTVVR